MGDKLLKNIDRSRMLGRRDVLKTLAGLVGAASTCLPGMGAQTLSPHGSRYSHPVRAQADEARDVSAVEHPELQSDAAALLDEIEERAAHYFYERADSTTGLVYDRASASGVGPAAYGTGHEFPYAASIAATGFGLSAFCVAAQRKYLAQAQCEARVVSILEFFAHHCQQEHGFFFHYMDVRNGTRVGKFELSPIDTSLLLCGVLHAGRFFNNARIERLAQLIYQRVDWSWMMNQGPTMNIAWSPEEGFLNGRWNTYDESGLMYLLAIGSPSHPISPSSWDAIERKFVDYGGIRFISTRGALFVHQYPHIWFDLRGLADRHANYWINSISATQAHKQFSLQLKERFTWIDESIWGFTAGDTITGHYRGWSAPPALGDYDGTINPHAAGGSLPMMPGECLHALQAMRGRYPKSWTRYGFTQAFRPDKDWYGADVIASDIGLVMLMAENLRTGLVRKTFMENRNLRQAMRAVGFAADGSFGGASHP